MKRVLLAVISALMCAAVMTSCTGSAKDSIRNDAAELASEAKDNLNGMLSDGEVSDRDGVIEDNKYENDSRDATVHDGTEATEHDPDYYDASENVSEAEKGIFDSTEAPTDSDFI